MNQFQQLSLSEEFREDEEEQEQRRKDDRTMDAELGTRLTSTVSSSAILSFEKYMKLFMSTYPGVIFRRKKNNEHVS